MTVDGEKLLFGGDLTPHDIAEIDRLNPPKPLNLQLQDRIAKASEASKPLDAERLQYQLKAAQEEHARTYGELQAQKREVERLKAFETENRHLRAHLEDLRTLIRRLD